MNFDSFYFQKPTINRLDVESFHLRREIAILFYYGQGELGVFNPKGSLKTWGLEGLRFQKQSLIPLQVTLTKQISNGSKPFPREQAVTTSFKDAFGKALRKAKARSFARRRNRQRCQSVKRRPKDFKFNQSELDC